MFPPKIINVLFFVAFSCGFFMFLFFLFGYALLSMAVWLLVVRYISSSHVGTLVSYVLFFLNIFPIFHLLQSPNLLSILFIKLFNPMWIYRFVYIDRKTVRIYVDPFYVWRNFYNVTFFLIIATFLLLFRKFHKFRANAWKNRYIIPTCHFFVEKVKYIPIRDFWKCVSICKIIIYLFLF